MDNLNDKLKEMFEMIGTSLSNMILPSMDPLLSSSSLASTQSLNNRKQQQQPKTKPQTKPQSKSSCNSSNYCSSSSSSSSSATTSTSLQSNSKINLLNTTIKSKRHQRQKHHHRCNQKKEFSKKSHCTRDSSMNKIIYNEPNEKQHDDDQMTKSALPFASGLSLYLFEQQNNQQQKQQHKNQKHQLSSIPIINRRFNCSVFLIHCLKHNKIALTKPNKKQAVWMPFMPIPMNKSWNEGGLAGLLIILSNGDIDTFVQLKNNPPIKERWIIEVASIQLPQTLELINRITWMIQLDYNQNYKCCQDNDSLMWIDEKKLDSGTLDYMWGPELIYFYRQHIQKQQNDNKIGYKSNFIEYNLDNAFQFLPRNPPRTDEEAMLLSSNLSEKDIERLYSDYLDHCYPSMSMAFHSFRIYMTKYGFQFDDERLTNLFFAFNYNSNGSITFPELLMGLACIDCYSIHNEVRAKFVMRYYDIQKKNYLTQNDIRQMLISIYPKLTTIEIDKKLIQTLQLMMIDNTNTITNTTNKLIERISYKTFVSAVGNHRFRGTSKLCRADRPVFQMITNIIFTRNKKKHHYDKQNELLKWSSVIDEQYNGICTICKEKQIILSKKLLKINNNGYIDNNFIDSDSSDRLKRYHKRYHMNNNDNKHSKSKSSSSSSSLSSSSSSKNLQLKYKKRNKKFQINNINMDNDNESLINISLYLIKKIREFCPQKGTTKKPNGFMTNNAVELYDYLIKMEKYLQKIFESENRCVQISSPCYLIGDIHGNIDDLLTLEKLLWRQYPAIDSNLLFLGDYVDRGRWSIECIIYLFCMKILMPNKLTLLRGNHEVRPLQIHYSYRLELIQKYNDDYGMKIWDLTNRLFDRLPFCSIIDESIFCSHGGIPRSTLDINEIQRINNFIPEPEHTNPIVWEILWSDPIHQQQFLELSCLITNNSSTSTTEDQQQQQQQQQQYDGFLPNRKRGTAFVFNEDAATKFLKNNGLTHLVRAHEVPTNGFFFHFDKKCATIFSSSHYCGNNNECAVILIEGDTIRVIRIDTTNNQSATD